MDHFVPTPDGAGGGAYAHAHPPTYLPPEKAKKFFEAFRRGSFTVILLGDVEEQRMHFVKPSEEEKQNNIRGHMALCTASRGSCHHCRARLAGEVLIQESQPYHLGPAYVRKGDRGDFEQKVITLTDGMRKELCDQLGPIGWRGHRFELHRSSTQKYKIVLASKSHVLAHKLPVPFAVLPFVRARFELPQDQAEPLVFLPNYSHRELTAGVPERPKTLALTASDCQTAEEWAKVKGKLAELRERSNSAPNGAESAAVVVAAPSSESPGGPPAQDGTVLPVSLLTPSREVKFVEVVKPTPKPKDDEPVGAELPLKAVLARVNGGSVVEADAEAKAELERKRTRKGGAA